MMQRKTVLAALGIASISSLSAIAKAQSVADAREPLPVKSVTMFTSGVSYIERGGAVTGNANVLLSFRTGQINDILKSMVLLDEKGKVQPVTFATKDPIGHTLQSFAVDVSENSTMEDLLTKLRGARVSVDSDHGIISGQIVSVESRQVAGADKSAIPVTFLNILTDAGLISVKMDRERTVKLLDDRLNREFKEALGILASGSDDQRKKVTLHFAGNGSRQVRVGYVTESPLWKMSYRLVVSPDPMVKPYLQGWALVENTTDEDWKNIKLSLVSGRPISFIQDLYQPLYIPRPEVAPDVIASPFPQTHGADMLEKKRDVVNEPAKDGDFAGVNGKQKSRQFVEGDSDGNGVAGKGRLPNSMMGRMVATPAALGTTEGLKQSTAQQSSGQSAGAGLFKYNITSGVTLPRQQAAMIPVVSKDISVEKLCLYELDTEGKFPLNALRIINSTGLHLKGGPITLFDQGTYAGDAKMEDVPPSDSRLISYAVDLDIEVNRETPQTRMSAGKLSIKRGVLIYKRTEREEATYDLKSKSDKQKTVLIEHHYEANYKLITPAKASERTADRYRFAVTVPARKTASLKVITEKPIYVSYSILSSDTNTLAAFATGTGISASVRDALQGVIQRRRAIANLKSQADAKDAEITGINVDQERIRKNMGALDRNSELYKRYVSTLNQQESHIQELRLDAINLRNQMNTATKNLAAYLDGLTVGE